jgi:hypothetical protein
VSDIAFPWIALRPSVRAGRLAAFGLLASGVSTLAAALSLLLAPTPGRGFAALACLGACFGAFIIWRRRPIDTTLRVTPEADIQLRAGQGDAVSMRPTYVSRWLIVLADDQAVVTVWPDRLAATEFRRLAVACRWRRPAAKA